MQHLKDKKHSLLSYTFRPKRPELKARCAARLRASAGASARAFFLIYNFKVKMLQVLLTLFNSLNDECKVDERSEYNIKLIVPCRYAPKTLKPTE